MYIAIHKRQGTFNLYNVYLQIAFKHGTMISPAQLTRTWIRVFLMKSAGRYNGGKDDNFKLSYILW
jgi:hypothetical protein